MSRHGRDLRGFSSRCSECDTRGYLRPCGLLGTVTHPSVLLSEACWSTITVLVNGVEVPGTEVDTDPYVYGIGAELAGGGVLTAVLPRAEFKRIQVQFTTRS
jgi:hypothetical protein